MFFSILPCFLQLFSQITQSLTNVRTYVGEDGKLHFVDSQGADTVLPFSSGYKEVAIVFADYQRVAACILINPDKSVIYGWGSLQGDYMTLNASGNGNCSIIAKKAGKYLVFDTQATVPKTSTTQVDASANMTIVMSTATTHFSINVAVALQYFIFTILNGTCALLLMAFVPVEACVAPFETTILSLYIVKVLIYNVL